MAVPLPSWAWMLASTVLRSFAAFLQLDWAERTRNPLHPQLRAAMRWVAADDNHYVTAAAADATRAGLDDNRLTALGREGYAGWSASDLAALVGATGFYSWQRWPACSRQQQRGALIAEIKVSENVVDQLFEPVAANHRTADITSIPIREGWLD